MRILQRALVAGSLLNAASFSGRRVAELDTSCSGNSTQFYLSDPPYENYFYSDCHLASQVVVTSPLPDSNLTLIGPRLLNSTTTGTALVPIYEPQGSENPVVGITGSLELNSSASLTVAILGSIRTIRDFTEGPSLLEPIIQDAVSFSAESQEKVIISRLWLDNITTTTLSFESVSSNSTIQVQNSTVNFTAGTYIFNASFNYPQLEQLTTTEVLNNQSQGLITQNLEQTQSLSFLSYSDKLLAGAWRFLTYFGRDSMISLLLMESILSLGEGGAIEAVIGAVIERINRTDGSVTHEETIGDYATYLNLQDNITSTAPLYNYGMIDSDFYFPVVLSNYFVKNPEGRNRSTAFMAKTATVDPDNQGLTYQQLALRTVQKIMNLTAPFAAPGNQVKENLVHLKDGQIVGQWRDSTYGIGGGRIPYDVNTALAPAALRAIATLAAAEFFPEHPEWNVTANAYAQVWEDSTLQFFEVTVPTDEARSLVQAYTSDNDLPFPSHSEDINSTIIFHGLALNGYDNQTLVKVMNTDDCFRHFLLNTTNQTQLSSFLSQTADHILQPFPVGYSTDVGLLISNPAYGNNSVYAANWTNSAYHGTVVWSWPLAMMAAGLERQLGRCNDSNTVPDFCNNATLRNKVASAYSHLWDLIDANTASLSTEVWSWTYEGGQFVTAQPGDLPPPPGTSPTESDIRQLWSLTFLAISRDSSLK